MPNAANRANPVVMDRWYKTFLGQHQQHTYWLYKVIDDIITSNPQLKRILEIGAGAGALSAVLAMHAVQRGGFLLTYEHKPQLCAALKPVFTALNVEVRAKDHWADLARIKEFMGDIPTFFFCDGGNKKAEFDFYADHIPSGSVIAAHDYGVEVMPEDIQFTADRLGLEPLQKKDWVGGKDEIQACFWKKP